MPLKPIHIYYYGDLFRFFIDQSKLPEVSLSYVERHEGATTHSERVTWESVPLDLKEILLEQVAHL